MSNPQEVSYFKICFLPEARPVMTTAIEGKDYPIGWVYERRNSQGGRSFSFFGGHFHDNFASRAFRQAVVNGILWTAHIDVSEKGAPISITSKEMELPPEEQKKKYRAPIGQIGEGRRAGCVRPIDRRNERPMKCRDNPQAEGLVKPG